MALTVPCVCGHINIRFGGESISDLEEMDAGNIHGSEAGKDGDGLFRPGRAVLTFCSGYTAPTMMYARWPAVPPASARIAISVEAARYTTKMTAAPACHWMKNYHRRVTVGDALINAGGMVVPRCTVAGRSLHGLRWTSGVALVRLVHCRRHAVNYRPADTPKLGLQLTERPFTGAPTGLPALLMGAKAGVMPRAGSRRPIGAAGSTMV